MWQSMNNVLDASKLIDLDTAEATMINQEAYAAGNTLIE